MAQKSLAGYSVARGFAGLGVACALVLATVFYTGSALAVDEGESETAAASASQEFDSGFTDRTVAGAKADLGDCHRLPEKERIECVSEVLRKVGRRLSDRADYYEVARVFKTAAKQVGAAKTIGVALRILTSAKKSVLRAYGDKHHLDALATIMETAKSVLRS